MSSSLLNFEKVNSKQLFNVYVIIFPFKSQKKCPPSPFCIRIVSSVSLVQSRFHYEVCQLSVVFVVFICINSRIVVYMLVDFHRE